MNLKIVLNNLIGLSGYRIYKVDMSERSYGKNDKRPELFEFVKKYVGKVKGNWIDVGSGAWGAVGSYEEIRNFFKKNAQIKTFEMNGGADIVGDITHSDLPSNSLDGVFIFETLEHVSDPFKAISEIHRLLKPGGMIVGSTPFFYELHGEEYGDFWRFTRQGIRRLLADFKEIDVKSFGRNDLKPHHYAFVAKK